MNHVVGQFGGNWWQSREEFGRSACNMGQDEGRGSGKIALKRELGLFSAVSIIVAVMIGMDTFPNAPGTSIRAYVEFYTLSS